MTFSIEMVNRDNVAAATAAASVTPVRNASAKLGTADLHKS
jgi:hypothetical protein